MRQPRPSSMAAPDAVLRSLPPSEVRDEYVVAGEGVRYNAVLVLADRFEVFPIDDRARRKMRSYRYAPGFRPTRSWPIHHPDKPLSNVGTMSKSRGTSVGSSSDTIFQSLAAARQS